MIDRLTKGSKGEPVQLSRKKRKASPKENISKKPRPELRSKEILVGGSSDNFVNDIQTEQAAQNCPGLTDNSDSEIDNSTDDEDYVAPQNDPSTDEEEYSEPQIDKNKVLNNYSQMRKNQLIAKCRKKRIGTLGNRNDLIERLESHDRVEQLVEKETPMFDKSVPCDGCSNYLA